MQFKLRFKFKLSGKNYFVDSWFELILFNNYLDSKLYTFDNVFEDNAVKA